MLLIVPHGRSPGMLGATFVQLPPPSRETCTSPSFVPTQSSLGSSCDSAIAKTTPEYSTPMLSGVRPPELRCRLLSLRVRSGLISRHVLPPSAVTCTCWLPTYTLLWSCGLIVRGNVQTKRYFRLSAPHPMLDCGQTSTSLVT